MNEQTKKTTNKMFNDTKSIFEDNVNDIVNKAQLTDFDHILNTMYLMMYRENAPSEIIQIFHMLGLQNMLYLYSVLGGKSFRFETIDSFKDYLILAILYYLKEIKQLKSVHVRELLPFNISKDDWISYGIRLKNFKNDIKKTIEASLKNVKINKKQKSKTRSNI